MIDGQQGNGPWQGCVLDGYDFDDRDAAWWKERVDHLIVIDDFGKPSPLADLAVCPGGPEHQQRISGVPLLSGFDYAMLDPAFAEAAAPPGRTNIESILICFGWRDSADATSLALEALAGLGGDGFAPRITVAIGSGAPHLDNIKRLIAVLGPRARLVVDTPGLRELLSEADIGIGAGGVGLLERMAAGVPSLTVRTAMNQARQVSAAASQGGTVDAGGMNDLTPAKLASRIASLARDVAGRAAMSARARQVVDGRGVYRIADKLRSLSQSPMTCGA